MQKITRTFLRTKETMDKYIVTMKQRRENGGKVNPFVDPADDLVKEFNYWNIIKNEFPYDAIASVSHMISTKREIPFDWELLDREEKDELEILRRGYLNENYDVVYENLPKGQTVPMHFHLHLLLLKREEE